MFFTLSLLCIFFDTVSRAQAAWKINHTFTNLFILWWNAMNWHSVVRKEVSNLSNWLKCRLKAAKKLFCSNIAQLSADTRLILSWKDIAYQNWQNHSSHFACIKWTSWMAEFPLVFFIIVFMVIKIGLSRWSLKETFKPSSCVSISADIYMCSMYRIFSVFKM